MSRGSGALPALARWRAFGEARAADRFQREAYATSQADRRAEDASLHLQDVSHSMSDLIGAARIDLPRLQLASQIHDAAADRLQEQRELSDAARELRNEAQRAYAAARADTRMVDVRARRRAAVDSERQEKLMFDRMADMQTRTRSARDD